jgi:hypothetical protein
MNSDTFFVVWNPERGLPRFKHDNYQAAVTEAKRLARETPDEPFYVLASCVAIEAKSPIIVTPMLEHVTEDRMPLTKQELPF